MLWFALHLHALPLEAWLVGLDAQAAQSGLTARVAAAAAQRPCCVIEARRVLQANAAARAAGICPGMSLATANSLAAGLQAFTRDPAREAAQVQRLALALARFTPKLVLQADGLLLEVQASLRLFKGARALWLAVRHTARAAGALSLRMAAAPTASAAAVLVRAEPARLAALRHKPLAEQLDALPLATAAQAWPMAPRLRELLQGIGCRTLGDVRRLPRSGAHRRGAAALLEAIARAHGQAPDPQTWFELPPRFEQSLELTHRAEDAAMLVFAAQRLVQPLAGWLAQQWLAAARLSLLLRHETSIRQVQPDTTLALALADPSRDAAQITLLLRERLQRFALPAPVYAITLRLDEAVGHAGRAAALWREAGLGQAEEAHALFDRLAARLGPERVRRLLLAADHRPERAMLLVPAHQAHEAAAPSKNPKLEKMPPRPTWLLPQPQSLATDARFGRPLYQGAPLRLASRAERIEAGWFDGEVVSRDYHLAQAKDQRWLWVFRERRSAQPQQSQPQPQDWYLHGIFG
jgi:protein ImuB